MKSWIEWGVKSTSVYLKTREKVPVFSIDWIGTENIRAIAFPEVYGNVEFDDQIILKPKGKEITYNAKLDIYNFYKEHIMEREL
mmetsp:Transcript_12480/g.14026  ORF Transcript_12480/g.14026 Transcript_12480/m.14026 type:complete len:84 (-) Transcript_12480:166-417(-)